MIHSKFKQLTKLTRPLASLATLTVFITMLFCPFAFAQSSVEDAQPIIDQPAVFTPYLLDFSAEDVTFQIQKPPEPQQKQVTTLQNSINNAANKHGVNPAFLQALAVVESKLNPNITSYRGAVGLMQIMPATAVKLGLRATSEHTVSKQLKDPNINLDLGAKYIKILMRIFPNRLDLVAAAYNTGEGAVLRAGRKIPNINETKLHVHKVMQVFHRLNGNTTKNPDA